MANNDMTKMSFVATALAQSDPDLMVWICGPRQEGQGNTQSTCCTAGEV